MVDWGEMTREERNRLVAEEIMGLSPCPHYEQSNLGSAGGPVLIHQEEECDCEGETYPEPEVGSIHGTIGGCPNYTFNPQIAMRVANKLHEESPEWNLTLEAAIHEDVSERYYIASFGDETVNAELPAEAICLAALKAKGLDVE